VRRLGVDNGGNLHVLHRDRPLRLSRKSASAASRPRRCAPSTAARPTGDVHEAPGALGHREGHPSHVFRNCCSAAIHHLGGEWPGEGASLYLICGALIPVVGLILRSLTRIFTPLQNPLTSLTFDNYSRVLDADGYRQSITNSLIVSGIGAILVAAIAVAAAVMAKRSTFRFSKTIEYLALGAPRYEAAAALEQAALAELRERRPDRAIETNVEFWAAVILDFAEVPTLMMPAMFTCGRTAGWCAHILE
jgi:hypothetical protein